MGTGLPTKPAGSSAKRMLPGSTRRRELTPWQFPSPKTVIGRSGEEKFDHSTQKLVEPMRRPILIHLRRGELEYARFWEAHHAGGQHLLVQESAGYKAYLANEHRGPERAAIAVFLIETCTSAESSVRRPEAAGTERSRRFSTRHLSKKPPMHELERAAAAEDLEIGRMIARRLPSTIGRYIDHKSGRLFGILQSTGRARIVI